MNPSLDYTRAMQRECAEYIIAGGPDQHGARLGLSDWFAEEMLMVAEEQKP